MMDGKVVIVTGGSGLLGRSIVRYLSDKGAIVINLDIQFEKNDSSAEAIQCDITKDREIETAIGQIKSKYQKIDGLVNNAYPRTSDWGIDFEKLSKQSLRKNIDYQQTSYFIMCQQVLPIMREQQFGSIVNIASIYGVVGNDFTLYEGTEITPPSEYPMIKGGIINLTRYLASLYGKYNVRINCVSPGGIFDNQPEKFVESYQQKVPLKRMGTPEDISPSVAFLLSDEACYITGHNLLVDGGWTAI